MESTRCLRRNYADVPALLRALDDYRDSADDGGFVDHGAVDEVGVDICLAYSSGCNVDGHCPHSSSRAVLVDALD